MTAPVVEVPRPIITAPWLATQIIPSPELAIDHGTAFFGMQWQLTPVLYSFGTNRHISPWRGFVIDPFARQSGSVEGFISPEFIARSGDFSDQWSVRLGTRAYFPLVDHGEVLSASLGAAVSTIGRGAADYEAGVYTLNGFIGGVVTVSPTPDAPRFIFTLRIRVF
jgi:hypothetical protein